MDPLPWEGEDGSQATAAQPASGGRCEVHMYTQLMQRLRKTGGRLGTLSLLSAAILGVVGLVGAVAMILSIVADLNFWANDNGARSGSLGFFLVMVLGAVGFVIEDEH